MASAEFKELKSLIMRVDKKVSDFSQQLEKVEHNLTGMINEMKTDVNILKTKYDESQLEITSLRQDFTELEQGVAVTRQLFSQNLKIEQRKANAIPIVYAHRVPTRGSGPKPIIVRFIHYGDKQLIMSSAHNLKVVNICTDDTTIQDASNTVIIKADLKQNCTCKLSAINQDKAIIVNFQRYNQETSSSPSHYGCGLILKFGSIERMWEAQCIVDDSIVLYTLAINGEMTIRSLTVNGTLKQNEGYCIEIRNGVHDDSLGNKLNLTCGIGSTTAYSTTAAIAKTTRSSTDVTNPLPLMTTRTTEHQLTTSLDSNEFISATVTSTDVPQNTKLTNQQQKDKGIDDTALYVSISVTVLGVTTVLIVTIMVLYYRRFRILTQCRNRTCSGSNTIYDTLSLPSSVNGADNTSISNNYSSLNINDFLSSCDNRRLDGTQNIPLSTISTVQGNSTNVSENERKYENTNKSRSEYANLVF
ncbi:unnamed protein product [Mytilus coruscus]|uniref:Uncharacterized protein n=1 Tax=Mytilus coruscus TaxID=42192 RepID=A0A6J8F560_MYTCO|nr:unnamed protein product [Mytilus coruscus]